MEGEAAPAPLPAGDFSDWLFAMRAALWGERTSDVPCDGCTACCRSSQFIHIAPDETETLAHIPSALLFPAPRLPAGHVLLGYDEEGCCPMLIGDQCSIYRYRPRTCRTYDCRVFPAAAVELEDNEKTLVAERARRWRFDFPHEKDGRDHRAVQAAAVFLRRHTDLLPNGAGATDPTQLAVLAVETAELFLASGRSSDQEPDPPVEVVRVALASRGAGTTRQQAPPRP
jgi:Fe-S-cluster containining protein